MIGLKALLAALAFARIIAGEAPACDDPQVFVALAHVNANRIEAGIEGGWFGDADPQPIHVWAALNFQRYPDPTDGAIYAIGTHDHLPWLAGQQPTAVYHCRGGQSVRTFR